MNVAPSRAGGGSRVSLGAVSCAFACAALVAALAAAGAMLGDAMPQVSSGGDVLSVAFGDAKRAISLSMVQKADSYFHGGIDMECHEAHGHHGEDEGGEGHGGEERREVSGDARGGFRDPWRWINSRIRAPEVHRHLQGAEAIHTIPWLWASVRADPHNVDAWTTAWFLARNSVKDADLAWRIIEEGKAKNPGSLEILFYEARHVYDSGMGDAARAEGLFRHIVETALARCGGDESALSEDDAWMLKYSRSYLEDIAKKRAAK